MGFDGVTKRRETPLVACKNLTQPREREGLGFIDSQSHAQALLSKWVFKALLDPSTKWDQLFLTFFEEFAWEQKRSVNRVHYSSLDYIQLGMVRTRKSMT